MGLPWGNLLLHISTGKNACFPVGVNIGKKMLCIANS